ncbi:hypothetical protein EV1_044919 [Malus domestica]
MLSSEKKKSERVRLTGDREIENRTAEPYRRSTAAETRGNQRPTDGGDRIRSNIDGGVRSDLKIRGSFVLSLTLSGVRLYLPLARSGKGLTNN